MTVIKTPAGPLVVEPVDEGWGSVEWLMDDRVVPGVRHSVARIRVLPGAESPRQRHPAAAETAVLLSGEITCVVDGKPLELWPGDVALIPAGAQRYLRNESRKAATVLLSSSAGAVAAR